MHSSHFPGDHANTPSKQFEIRLCPSLANKEKAVTSAQDVHPMTQKGPKGNPFLPPYKEGLYIGEITEDDEPFVILVSSMHFLLGSKLILIIIWKIR